MPEISNLVVISPFANLSISTISYLALSILFMHVILIGQITHLLIIKFCKNHKRVGIAEQRKTKKKSIFFLNLKKIKIKKRNINPLEIFIENANNDKIPNMKIITLLFSLKIKL